MEVVSLQTRIRERPSENDLQYDRLLLEHLSEETVLFLCVVGTCAISTQL